MIRIGSKINRAVSSLILRFGMYLMFAYILGRILALPGLTHIRASALTTLGYGTTPYLSSKVNEHFNPKENS